MQMQDRDRQARSPAKASCSPPQFLGSALQVRDLELKLAQSSTWFPVTGPKRFKYQGHNYFYSGDVAPYKKIKYDWLDGRNFCRWEKEEDNFSDFQGILHGPGFPGDPAGKWLHSKLAWLTQPYVYLDFWKVQPTFNFAKFSSFWCKHSNTWSTIPTTGFVTLTAVTDQTCSRSVWRGGFGLGPTRRLHQPTKSMRGKIWMGALKNQPFLLQVGLQTMEQHWPSEKGPTRQRRVRNQQVRQLYKSFPP